MIYISNKSCQEVRNHLTLWVAPIFGYYRWYSLLLHWTVSKEHSSTEQKYGLCTMEHCLHKFIPLLQCLVIIFQRLVNIFQWLVIVFQWISLSGGNFVCSNLYLVSILIIWFQRAFQSKNTPKYSPGITNVPIIPVYKCQSKLFPISVGVEW